MLINQVSTKCIYNKLKHNSWLIMLLNTCCPNKKAEMLMKVYRYTLKPSLSGTRSSGTIVHPQW